jgi:hypothetical protein
MAKLKNWPVVGIVLGLLAAGCGQPKSVSGLQGGATRAYERPTEMPNYAHKAPPPTTGLGTDNKITGSGEWNTGRKTEPQPKALEKDITVRGTVASSGAGSLTVNLAGGGSMSFQGEETTMVFRAGDSRFFALEGGIGGLAEGTPVTVMGYNKGGQNFARQVSVGEGGFVVPDLKNKKQ